MNERRPDLQPGSSRAEELVEAWNRKDVAFILDQFSDNVRVEARSPKLPDPPPNLHIRSKAQLALALEAYRALHSRFSIISASEDAAIIVLALHDAAGDVLVLTLEYGEGKKIKRISTFRDDKPAA